MTIGISLWGSFVNPTGHLQEIRQAFEEEGRSSGKGRLLLSAAVAAGKDNIDTAYDVPAVSKWATVTTADFLPFEFLITFNYLQGTQWHSIS